MTITPTEMLSPEGPVIFDQEAQRRLDELQATLAGVQHVEVADMGPLQLAGDDPLHYETQRFMNGHPVVGTTLFLHPDNQELTGAAEMSFVPRSARSGQHSAHGVMFGDMLFSTGEVVPVAIKPHEDDREQQRAAVHEYLTDVAVRQLELDNLVPFGMLVNQHGTSYSITLLEEGLTSLDTVNWTYVAEHVDDYTDLLEIWENVARYTAMLHASGNVCQGDLAARNLVLRPDNGGVFAIDWEKARISTTPPRDVEVSYANSSADMKELIESMVRPPSGEELRGQLIAGIGLLRGSLEDQWSAFNQLVFQEYRSTRLGFAESKGTVHDTLDEMTELERTLKQHLALVNHQLGRDQ